MMAIFRLAALWLVIGFAACTVLHTLTGDAIWRQRARGILKWGVVLGMVLVGLLVLRRGAMFI
jgi:hypothetical protein